ncbi:MAG: hypothetical protein ABI551_11485 [Polyangiaceae bacterium]
MQRVLAVVLASAVALLAACSSDGNAAGPPCSSTQGCPSDLQCWYAKSDGCSGSGHCFAPASQGNGACKAASFCACDGTLVLECGRQPGDGLSDQPLHGDVSDPFCAADAG